MAELHRLLLMRAGIAPALAALRKIEQSVHVSVRFSDEALHEDALQWLERLPDQTITYTDATSFAVMARSKCNWALAFDHDFVLAGYSLWVGE